MSNVIEFRPASDKTKAVKAAEPPGRKSSAKDRDQINERIASLGGEAIESFGRWRAGLPIEDRIRLARNMDILIREFKVKSGKLDWERYGYQDKESFNRDLSRMRLPETAEPGRRLLAHNTRWLHLLEMIHQYCADGGEQVTLEALAERLTRGTRFHPTKKIHSRAEKLLYSLKLLANEVDQEHGLLKTYRQIAEARAEHFKLFMCDFGQDAPDSYEYEDAMERPIDSFINIPDEWLPLFRMELGSYSENDWKEFLTLIPEDSISVYQQKKFRVDDWNANFNPRDSLFCGWTGEGTPSLSWLQDVKSLPHWFLGFYDCHDYKLLSKYPEKPGWPAIFSHSTGTLDPMMTQYEGYGEHYTYLTLYPNPEMSRIVPYFYSFTEEWSTFECLREDHLTDIRENFFPPVGPGQEAISKPMQGRVEEDYPMVKEHWMNTADGLKSHPLLMWSKSREKMIDAEIERLTTGTRQPDE